MSDFIAVERLDVETSQDLLQIKLHQQRYDFALNVVENHDRVLEIGTGAGILSRALATKCASYVGLNIDEKTCERTRQKLNGRGLVVEGDAQNLPFEAHSFSTVICLEVLEHLEDYRLAVSEIRRSLTEDGKAIISVPYVKRGGASSTNKYHLYEPGETELIEEFEKHFSVVDTWRQSFPETTLMTFARRFHLRRALGFADVYRRLVKGDVSTLGKIEIGPLNLGFCFNLILVASKPLSIGAEMP